MPNSLVVLHPFFFFFHLGNFWIRFGGWASLWSVNMDCEVALFRFFVFSRQPLPHPFLPQPMALRGIPLIVFFGEYREEPLFFYLFFISLCFSFFLFFFIFFFLYACWFCF